MDVDEIRVRLGEIQTELINLPDDAFGERHRLREEQDRLRTKVRTQAADLDKDRTTEDLLNELGGLRAQMKSIEKMRIDLVMQAGSGGATSAEMGNLGGVKINKGIDDAQGLPAIKARIGLIKGILINRDVEVPEAD